MDHYDQRIPNGHRINHKFRITCTALLVFFLSTSVWAVKPKFELGDRQRLITILQTNDIHGGIEPEIDYKGRLTGGMAIFVGAARAIKKGLKAKYQDRAGVLIVDSGDQFQGTLVSNYNEGALMFRAMNVLPYDAVVPGNHDYDFGPKGWLDDTVNPKNPDKNPRGALLRLIDFAKFPLLSANVYYKKSIVDHSGNPVHPRNTRITVDWSKAKKPKFFKPYIIKKTAGVRVALIGMDHPRTERMTIHKNVSDLYFRNIFKTYLEVRAELDGKADVFVLVMHDGNSGNSEHATKLLKKLTAKKNRWSNWTRTNHTNTHVIDALVAGHTHQINNKSVRGVPIVQSRAGGLRFGRIDLIWNDETQSIILQKTRTFAGVPLYHKECAYSVKDFCIVETTPGKSNTKKKKVLKYEKVIVRPSKKVMSLIKKERKKISHLADRVLGNAKERIKRHRIYESALSNIMTDALRKMSGSDIAMINTGGIRDNIEKGTVTYENLFKVFPFSNHGVKIGPMNVEKVMEILTRTAQSCGAYSAIMQSGLRILYERDCKNRSVDDVDIDARLLNVQTLDGEIIYEAREGGIQNPNRVFNVATIDFLTTGGSGYDSFKGVPILEDMGILREVITERFLKHPQEFNNKRDGRFRRWVNRSSSK